MFIFLFLCSLLVPLSMTFLGYTWKDNPPKDRQGISGYRTTMSRINDETWKYDKTQHWQECSCGERLNVATHTYGDWKVTKEATETEEGSRERGCAVCEYVQTEAIPAAGTGEPTDSTDPTDSSDSQGQQDPSGDTGSPQTGDSSDMALWISLMLASCGGVLGMLFYRRKKAAAGK